MASGIRFLKNALSPTNEISIWFAEDDPTLRAYYEFNNEFGNDRVIFLSFERKSGLIEPSALKNIQLLTEQLQSIDGVKKAWSITNAKDVRRIKQNGTSVIQFTSYFENGIPASNETLAALKHSILSSPLMANRFINDEGNVGMIIIQLDPLKKIDIKRNIIIDKINEVSIKILGPQNVHLGGSDIVTYGLNQLSRHDLTLFTTLNYALMLLIILLFFPRSHYLILTILTTFTAILITLSVYGYFGYRLNIFTIIIPSLIIILGMIIVLHIINEFEILHQNKKEDEKNSETVKLAFINIYKPCLFTTLTTMIGFLSLLSSSTSVLREFGIFAALGTLLAFICAFIFSAVLLSLIKTPSIRFNPRALIASTLVRFSDHIFRYPRVYWTVLILMVFVSAFGITQINLDMYPMGYFPSDSKVVKDHDFIREKWGNYFTIDLMLETRDKNDLRDPKMINAIIDFEKEASEQPEIRNTFSFVHIIERFSEIVYKRDLQRVLYNPFLREALIRNVTKIMGQDSGILVNEDYTKARITLIGPIISFSNLENKLIKIGEIGEKHFGDMAHLTVVGYPALFIKLLDYAFGSMIKSLFIAFILIFISMAFLLKNFKLALIAMIPNIFPIVIFLGFLGYSRINLDLATSMVAAIVLGIAIDDTIHFLTRYYRERSDNVDLISAVRKTHYHVGRIIVISSLILFLGFSILLFASIKTVFYFGLLTALSVIAALIGDLVMLPLLLKISD